jgi:signal transduction histidine kinase
MKRKLATLPSIEVGRIALLDAYGKIVAVNKQWLDLAEQTGSTRVGPGVNYLEICSEADDSADARAALKGIRDVLQKKLQTFTMDYSVRLPSGPALFRMFVLPFSHGQARVAVTHVDITDLQLSKDQHFRRVRQFAHRLMRRQEEERERISREIHDDLSNRIALLASLVRRIKSRSSKRSTSRGDELDDLTQSITDLSNALRDLSRGLHPPVLKYAGICAALTSLCEEFGRNHHVEIKVDVPPERPQLPDEVELSLFRISQECLTNVAKHSGANKVTVVLEATSREVRLNIADTGSGFIPADAIQKGGLGLVSMEERIVSLGGKLAIRSAVGAGTEIRVTIPTHNAMSF